jgi:nucleoside-diphosphate-sugar epimerase
MPVDGHSPQPAGRCLLTGATGYVGGRIKAALLAAGWQVTELGRNAGNGSGIKYRLGDEIAADNLRGHTALVHCAYDFTALGWAAIHDMNVLGSERLLRAARDAGVERSVLISTISAYEGSPSLYGKAKLETEGIARSLGAWLIRPGLVYGGSGSGMFAKLAGAVKQVPVIPMPGWGGQVQYLVHADDLAQSVLRCLQRDTPAAAEPVTVAHAQPWPFRALLLEIARALNRRVVLVPVPWRLMWAGLKTLETLGKPLGFRSDSLVSLVNQNPRPRLNAQEVLGVSCRPFDAAAAIRSPSGRGQAGAAAA